MITITWKNCQNLTSPIHGLWFGLSHLRRPFMIFWESLAPKKTSGVQKCHFWALWPHEQFLNQICYFGSQWLLHISLQESMLCPTTNGPGLMGRVIPSPTDFDFVATNSDTIYPLQMAAKLGVIQLQSMAYAFIHTKFGRVHLKYI